MGQSHRNNCEKGNFAPSENTWAFIFFPVVTSYVPLFHVFITTGCFSPRFNREYGIFGRSFNPFWMNSKPLIQFSGTRILCHIYQMAVSVAICLARVLLCLNLLLLSFHIFSSFLLSTLQVSVKQYYRIYIQRL